MVVTQSQDFTTLDPALAQTPDAWELEYATCAKLLNYPPRVGYRGTKLVPGGRGVAAEHLARTV